MGQVCVCICVCICMCVCVSTRILSTALPSYGAGVCERERDREREWQRERAHGWCGFNQLLWPSCGAGVCVSVYVCVYMCVYVWRDVGGRGKYPGFRSHFSIFQFRTHFLDLICTYKVPLPRTQTKRKVIRNAETHVYVRHPWDFLILSLFKDGTYLFFVFFLFLLGLYRCAPRLMRVFVLFERMCVYTHVCISTRIHYEND